MGSPIAAAIIGPPKRDRLHHYKNTSNLRRKYRRKKFVFPTGKVISDGNSDGIGLVGIGLVAEFIPTESDGCPTAFPTEISRRTSRRTGLQHRRKRNRKWGKGISDGISDGNSRRNSLFLKKNKFFLNNFV